MAVHHFGHTAMAAPFEILISSDDQHYAAQATQSAFAEIDRLETLLSRYNKGSDISRLNAARADVPVSISPETYRCLEIAAKVREDTGRAFDHLYRTYKTYTPATYQGLLRLVPDGLFAVKAHQAVQIDLGAIGKGFACDFAAAQLKEWELDRVLLQAGGSTTLCLGAPEDEKGWPVGVGGVGEGRTPYRVYLVNRALSGSGIDVKGRHVIDPKTGEPALTTNAWACCPGAAVADALSTAFMVMGEAKVKSYCDKHPATCGMVLTSEGVLHRFGPWETAAHLEERREHQAKDECHKTP